MPAVLGLEGQGEGRAEPPRELTLKGELWELPAGEGGGLWPAVRDQPAELEEGA